MKDKLVDFGLLWLRTLAGLGFMLNAWDRLTAKGVATFADQSLAPLGIPAPYLVAWAAIAAAFIGGFFMILGLWTRWAAAALTALSAAAVLAVCAGHSLRAAELWLAYLVMAGAVLLAGPGRYAVSGGRPTGRRPGRK